jgi:hypothetical protein
MMTHGHPLKPPLTPGPSILFTAGPLEHAAQAVLRTGDASHTLMAASTSFRSAEPPEVQEPR